MSQKIVCPNCKTEIDLDKISEERFKQQLEEQKVLLEKDREKQKLEFEKNLEKEKEEMREKAKKWADEKVEEQRKKDMLEKEDLKNRLKEQEKKQEESIKKELELRKQARELEEKAKNQELEMARKLDEEKKKMQEELENSQKKYLEEKLTTIQEDYKKRELEKDKQMDILKKSLEEANRKAIQGSQQIQGEIQEQELKTILTKNFPLDNIEDVPTGIKGADLIHTVRNNQGQVVGTILWESKNTKTWSNEWIKKLKDDKTIAKADVCIIVTNSMPEDIKHFGLVNDVWVCEFAYFLALTVAIRDKLFSIHTVSKSIIGKEEKMELLYNYLCSSDFKSKIENIINAFKSMKEDLESEKRSMARIWAKREKELERIINNTSFLYGDMQGIIGSSLGSIDYLELGGGE